MTRDEIQEQENIGAIIHENAYVWSSLIDRTFNTLFSSPVTPSWSHFESNNCHLMPRVILVWQGRVNKYGRGVSDQEQESQMNLMAYLEIKPMLTT